MIARLLRHNVSLGQTLGFALANLVGLLIVMTALQAYRDLTAVTTGSDSFLSADYLIISRRVEGVTGARPFTPEELSEIASQPWAAEVGAFRAADFNVSLSIGFGGQRLYTSLFLESIPDDFFDISPEGWDDYTPGGPAPLPIILSKDYLALYNFGFASARGLPQLSEQTVGMLPLRLSLSGAGRQEWINARIVGFSNRLNTIAVPMAFLDWANPLFAPGSASAPSRLIVKLKRAGDPAATDYITTHGYEVAGDRDAGSKMQWLLSMATTAVVAVGALILLLALFILVLSVYLLLQKNRSKILDLILLGYPTLTIARVYWRLIASVNAAVLAVACVALWLAASWWQPRLTEIGLTPAPLWPTLVTGLLLTLLITLIAAMAVKRNVDRA